MTSLISHCAGEIFAFIKSSHMILTRIDVFTGRRVNRNRALQRCLQGMRTCSLPATEQRMWVSQQRLVSLTCDMVAH